MQWELLQPAITGQVSHAEWMASVADALAEPVGSPERARAAVAAVAALPGRGRRRGARLRPGGPRRPGVRVGLATNATDLLDADLAALGLVGELDVVVNSSVIGVHKPAPGVLPGRPARPWPPPPARVLLVDDDDRAVRGARSAGLSAYRWSGHADLRLPAGALGLLSRSVSRR